MSEPRDEQGAVDRLMELWQRPWSESAFGEAQMLLSALRARLGDTSINADRLAAALRAAEQLNADSQGVKGPAYEGPPPEWYLGYAAAVIAAYDRLTP